jgi:hypothetical protein
MVSDDFATNPPRFAGSHPTARRFSGLAGAGPVGLSVPLGLIVGRPFRPFIPRRVGVAAAREIKEIPAGRRPEGQSFGLLVSVRGLFVLLGNEMSQCGNSAGQLDKESLKLWTAQPVE